jgi:hypothetical protein
LHACQYLYFCTRTASKVSTGAFRALQRPQCGWVARVIRVSGRPCCTSVTASPDHSRLSSAQLQQYLSAYVSVCQHTSAYVSIRQHTSVLLVSVQLQDISVQLRNSLGTAWKQCRIPIGPTPCKPGRVTKLLCKIPRALDGVAGVYKAVDAAAFTLGRT